MGDISVEHVSTNKMWLGILTKPLQGLKFRMTKANLMKIPVDYKEDVILIYNELKDSNKVEAHDVDRPPSKNHGGMLALMAGVLMEKLCVLQAK